MVFEKASGRLMKEYLLTCKYCIREQLKAVPDLPDCFKGLFGGK